jgi:hypothetical protein
MRGAVDDEVSLADSRVEAEFERLIIPPNARKLMN